MLRITTNDESRMLLQLEGRLEGPWVDVLDDCWRSIRDRSGGKRICVDLNGVSFIDAAGKDRLRELHEQGAELLTDDLMTKAIVSEITGK